MSAEELKEAITKEQRRGLQSCFEDYASASGFAGEIALDIQLVVASDGRVVLADARSGPALHPALSQCVERKVMAWRFRPSSDTIQTELPLVFSSGSRGADIDG